MLPINFTFDALFADNTRVSPVSITNFPASKLAVSLDSIGKSLMMSVVTAIPDTDLSGDSETVYVCDPTFAA